MSSLGTLQREFQTAVTGESGTFVRRVRADSNSRAVERLGIYVDAYALRLIEALGENYPGLSALIGNETFHRVCRAYIREHPSTYRSIRWYGDHLSEFLDANPVEGQGADLVREMALVDWHMGLAFDAADAEPVDESGLIALSPDNWAALVFSLHPSIQRLCLSTDALRYRSALVKGDDVMIDPTPHDQPVNWLIWRQGLDIRYRSMEIDEAFALDNAAGGRTFSELCEGLTEWIDEEHVAARAVSFLKRWLADGLIVEFDIRT